MFSAFFTFVPSRSHRTLNARCANESKTTSTIRMKFKKHAFCFADSTICYAFIQAVDMVNDHTTACFRHRELKGPA
ncbi:DNA-3-methyladenine glycosylase I [Cerasicoccus maritimus]|uniref:DNA-3-methyladenine glycosylase I n=1 Tax=Cerasicoccus maritimus TaxID=490089 RepID=UPI002852756B|nr:DNA-3-methyladenine glycosylase I [Cerasicoccus maritimus]